MLSLVVFKLLLYVFDAPESPFGFSLLDFEVPIGPGAPCRDFCRIYFSKSSFNSL